MTQIARYYRHTIHEFPSTYSSSSLKRSTNGLKQVRNATNWQFTDVFMQQTSVRYSFILILGCTTLSIFTDIVTTNS